MEDDKIFSREYHRHVTFLHPVHEERGRVRIRNAARIEKENRDKDICLHCTKPTCSGSDKCFRKERNRKHD